VPYNQAIIDAVTGMIQAGQISQADGMALMGAFSGPAALQAQPPVTNDVDADLPLPYTVGFGVAYKASDKLTITADASMSNWSSWDTITIESDGGNTSLRQDWENTWEIGFGFEYKPSEALAIRGGFYTVDSPVPDETMSPTILDPNKRNVFTGGIGYKVGKIDFSLCGEIVTFGDKIIDDYHFDDATGVAENYAGTYKFNAAVVTLGAQINLN
jgi:long-chain fatty acid transport protein